MHITIDPIIKLTIDKSKICFDLSKELLFLGERPIFGFDMSKICFDLSNLEISPLAALITYLRQVEHLLRLVAPFRVKLAELFAGFINSFLG